MIKIIDMTEFTHSTNYTINFDAWDFPIEELDYLMETHNNETFLLYRDRLTEVVELH